MEKVYIVYHDNGMSCEDNWISVSKIFASKESAERHAEAENLKCETFKPYTEEEWKSMGLRVDDYPSYLEREEMEFNYVKQGFYYVEEYELNP